MRRLLPALGFISDHYFRAVVEDIELLEARPSLVVCTHNGGMVAPDLLALMVAFWRRHGPEKSGYGMLHQAGLRFPIYGPLLSRLGALPASMSNARAALSAGAPLIVCPGGDIDCLKPFRDRHRIQFGNRRGFIRLALEQQLPVVPVVSVGAHEIMLVLHDGRRLARLLHLPQLLRVKSAPLTLSFPFGLSIAGIPGLPLPAKVRVRVLPPIDLGEPPKAVDDPAIVERCFVRVRDTMQTALDDLASRRRRVFFG